MTVTITILAPDRARPGDPEETALRPAMVALARAVAVELAEELVPGLGVAVALLRVAHVVRVRLGADPDDDHAARPVEAGA